MIKEETLMIEEEFADSNMEEQYPEVQEYIFEVDSLEKSIKAEFRKLMITEKTEFLAFRKEWSRNLLKLVVLIVIFNASFLIVIGLGWLKYEDEWLVRIIFAGSFLEVLGLARIVVAFLFYNGNEKPEPKRKK